MHHGKRDLEHQSLNFRGGEERGQAVRGPEVAMVLEEALRTILYRNVRHKSAKTSSPDRTYDTNESFWNDALADKHFPEAYVNLKGFALTEWVPFAPGRYYTSQAIHDREFALQFVSRERDEYTPNGKISMVRGGIGTIRLAGKELAGHATYFLGASSSGITHQGIPIALTSDDYRKVMPVIKEYGGCRVDVIGRLQSISDNMPVLQYDVGIPRYCLFAEEVVIRDDYKPVDLLTTVAVMFTSDDFRDRDDLCKSWTFCSFPPGSSPREAQEAAEWLWDYAQRYSGPEVTILTDFDEHARLFPCAVEFLLADIVRGLVDWNTLKIYKEHFKGTYIEKFIQEYKVMGDQINVTGSGNIVVNRSKVEKAFNKVKKSHGEDVAKALEQVEQEINNSKNTEAGENFDSFNEELQKPEPRKSLLKSLWQGTLAALPSIKEIPGAITSIAKLFS